MVDNMAVALNLRSMPKGWQQNKNRQTSIMVHNGLQLAVTLIQGMYYLWALFALAAPGFEPQA